MTKTLATCIAILGIYAGTASAAQAPCTEAGASCTEMLAMPGVKGGTVIYRSYPLGKAEPAITHALIIVHGLGRDADSYYASALAATFTVHALDHTIVIAPHFSSREGSCKDSLASGEIGWHCQPRNDTWRTGGESVDGGVTSFDVIDELLRRLNDRAIFPNLKTIVVSGHSAGGQFVERYAMASTVHDSLAVKPSYVVMNPSSYAYLDELRPTERGVREGCGRHGTWIPRLAARAIPAALRALPGMQRAARASTNGPMDSRIATATRRR